MWLIFQMSFIIYMLAVGAFCKVIYGICVCNFLGMIHPEAFQSKQWWILEYSVLKYSVIFDCCEARTKIAYATVLPFHADVLMKTVWHECNKNTRNDQLKQQFIHCGCQIKLWGSELPQFQAMTGISKIWTTIYKILSPCWCSEHRLTVDDNVVSSQGSKDVKSHGLSPRGVGKSWGEGVTRCC